MASLGAAGSPDRSPAHPPPLPPSPIPRKVRITGRVFLVLGVLMALPVLVVLPATFGMEAMLQRMQEIEARKGGPADPFAASFLLWGKWLWLFRIAAVIQFLAGIWLFLESRRFLRLRKNSRAVLEGFAWFFALYTAALGLGGGFYFSMMNLPGSEALPGPVMLLMSLGSVAPYFLLALWGIRVLRSPEVRAAVSL